MRVHSLLPAVLLVAAPVMAGAQGRARASTPASAPRASAPRASAPRTSAPRASAPRASSAPAARHSRPATSSAPAPASAADDGRRVIGSRPRPVTTPVRPLPPSRGPHYYATSPRPTRPIGTFAPYWPHAPYYPYSTYGGRYGGYRRLPGLAPLIIILPTTTTVERSSTTYEPGYDDATYYVPGQASEYPPEYAPAPEPRIIEGVVPAAARSLVVELPADSLLRVRWSGDDRGVVEVALVVADAERRVLATQAVLDPPYTALFDRPARAAYAGVTLTYADGASTTILQPLTEPTTPAAPGRPPR